MFKTLVLRSLPSFLRDDAILRRLLSNSSWLLSGNIATRGLTLIQSAIVARMLGAEQFGVFVLITTFSGAVNQIVDSRVWETAIKYVTMYREDGQFDKATATIKLCYLIDLVTGIFAIMLLLMSAGLASKYFIKDPTTTGLIQLYALSIVILIPNGTLQAVLRIGNRFNVLAYQQVAVSLVKVVGVAGIAIIGPSLKAVLVVYLIATAFGVGMLLYYANSAARALNLIAWRSAPLRLLKGNFRRILGFALFTNLGATSRLITSNADVFVVGFFATPAVVGVYRLARLLANQLSIIFNPIFQAVYPEMAKLVGQKNFAGAYRLQSKLSKIISIVVFPLGLAMTVAFPWLIPLIFGKEYEGAVILSQILIWQLIWTPLIWLPGWLLSIEKVQLLTTLNWLDAGIYLILLMSLTGFAGAFGAATATVLRYVIWTIMALFIVKRINEEQHRAHASAIESDNAALERDTIIEY